MDRQDVRVLEAGCRADLAQEAFWPEGVRQLEVQDLERYRPVVPEVAREVDCGHAPAPELGLPAVKRFRFPRLSEIQVQLLEQGDEAWVRPDRVFPRGEDAKKHEIP
jgi:hypothetical protein